MKAEVEEISGVFRDGGDVQFILPRFQRAYAWEEKDWQTLWKDARKIIASNTANLDHFLGAMVVVNIETGINEPRTYQLVDGQQRLLTISIFLCALRNLAKSDSLRREILDYLVNEHRVGLQHYKILPTVNNDDRAIWRHLLKYNTSPEYQREDSLINRSYEYFYNSIKKYTQENGVDLAEIFRNFKKFLKIAVIHLDRDEQTHQIFESLNTKGKPLTQADLVRNYIALRLNATQQDEIWEKYWREIDDETMLSDKRSVSSRGRKIGELTGFFRHYLACQKYFLPNVGDVYEEFRNFMEESSQNNNDVLFEQEMKTLHRYAHHYKRLLDPDNSGEIGKQIDRLNEFEATASYPLLLYLYDLYSQEQVTADSFLECLRKLENFLVRSLVGGTTNNQANRLYPTIVRELVDSNLTDKRFITAFQNALHKRNYPSNERIREVLKTENMYEGGKSAKLKFILEEVSQQLAKKRALDVRTELIGKPTIEHIMPQRPRDMSQLGGDLESVHRDLVDNIGNLTIVSQSFNSTLSNRTFSDKRTELIKHGLDINHQYFGKVHQWNREEIENRRNWLVGLILEIWPSFGYRRSMDNWTRTWPTGLSIHDRPIQLEAHGWKYIAIALTEYIIANTNAFEYLSEEGLSILRRNRPNNWLEDACRQLSNGWWLKTNLSANKSLQHCEEIAELAGLSVEDWDIQFYHY